MNTLKPYIHLHEDKRAETFALHVMIKLEKMKVLNPNDLEIEFGQSLDKHLNRERLILNGPYQRHMNLARLTILVDDDSSNNQIWERSFPISYDDVQRGLITKDAMIQVVVQELDGHANHAGVSTGHFGDADDD